MKPLRRCLEAVRMKEEVYINVRRSKGTVRHRTSSIHIILPFTHSYGQWRVTSSFVVYISCTLVALPGRWLAFASVLNL